MVFMDMLSMKSKPLMFDQCYVRHVWDKLLLILLQGKITHFPEALQGQDMTKDHANVNIIALKFDFVELHVLQVTFWNNCEAVLRQGLPFFRILNSQFSG